MKYVKNYKIIKGKIATNPAELQILRAGIHSFVIDEATT